MQAVLACDRYTHYHFQNKHEKYNYISGGGLEVWHSLIMLRFQTLQYCFRNGRLLPRIAPCHHHGLLFIMALTCLPLTFLAPCVISCPGYYGCLCSCTVCVRARPCVCVCFVLLGRGKEFKKLNSLGRGTGDTTTPRKVPSTLAVNAPHIWEMTAKTVTHG